MPPRVSAHRAQSQFSYGQRVCYARNVDQNVRSQTRSFTPSAPQQAQSFRRNTRLRRNMFSWLNGPGRAFREPLPGSTNYLGAYDKSGRLKRLEDLDAEQKDKEQDDAEEATEEDMEGEENKGRRLPPARIPDQRPFPLNQYFHSQSVLSEELREKLYNSVVEQGQTIATVSAYWGVDMRRVAAVVRLKTIEKQWVAEGKKLATPYASAVLEMLPQTRYRPDKPITHESINDLPVHPSTRRQIFHPTSESRHFTRADAAKVFSPTLLPADDRIPHPDLIKLERDIQNDVPRAARVAAIRERDAVKTAQREEKERKQREWEQRNIKVVSGQRWDFKFQNINVEDAGKDGRGRAGVGWRYGVPHQDRKRGLIKIPTSVE